MKIRTVAMIQARMSSVRLPGKVLRELCGQPILYHIIQRIKNVENVDEIMIATSENKSDTPIVEFAEDHRIPYFCGSEEDVLDRFYRAAQMLGLKENDIIIRLTADNPFVDTNVLEKLLIFFYNSSFEYAVTVGYPLGIGAEVFTFHALSEAHEKALLPYEREHVTPFMYRPGQIYGKMNAPIDYSSIRLTIDTPEDYKVAQMLYESLYYQQGSFGLPEILKYLHNHPDITAINGAVHQKKLGE